MIGILISHFNAQRIALFGSVLLPRLRASFTLPFSNHSIPCCVCSTQIDRKQFLKTEMCK